MNDKRIVSTGVAVLTGMLALGPSAWAATAVQIGPSGKTYASGAVRCATNPATGVLSPVVDAGLFNPKNNARADILLDGALVASVTSAYPASNIWLADGSGTVVVALSRKAADAYAFVVQPGMCALPDTSGNTFSADGVLEYAASGKSYATVTPGCALNPSTGLTQPYVHLFDNGDYVLNVSVNGEPLTQLSASRPHAAVFLNAGVNVISAANGSLTLDYYVRDGGIGTCALQ